MEDKYFDLLSKMYGEFSEFRSETNKRFDVIDNRFDVIDNRFDVIDNRFDVIDNRFDDIDNKFDSVDGRLKKIEVIIEHEIKPDIKALYQIQVDINRKLNDHDHCFDKIDIKLENLQTEVNVLSGKYKKHSYEIGALKREKKVK